MANFSTFRPAGPRVLADELAHRSATSGMPYSERARRDVLVPYTNWLAARAAPLTVESALDAKTIDEFVHEGLTRSSASKGNARSILLRIA